MSNTIDSTDERMDNFQTKAQSGNERRANESKPYLNERAMELASMLDPFPFVIPKGWGELGYFKREYLARKLGQEVLVRRLRELSTSVLVSVTEQHSKFQRDKRDVDATSVDDFMHVLDIGTNLGGRLDQRQNGAGSEREVLVMARWRCIMYSLLFVVENDCLARLLRIVQRHSREELSTTAQLKNLWELFREQIFWNVPQAYDPVEWCRRLCSTERRRASVLFDYLVFMERLLLTVRSAMGGELRMWPKTRRRSATPGHKNFSSWLETSPMRRSKN